MCANTAHQGHWEPTGSEQGMGTLTQVPNGSHRPLTWDDTNRKGRQAEKRHRKAGREPGERSHKGRRGQKGIVASAEYSANGKLLEPSLGEQSAGVAGDKGRW